MVFEIYFGNKLASCLHKSCRGRWSVYRYIFVFAELAVCKTGFVVSPLISDSRRWCLCHLVAHSSLKTGHWLFTIKLCCKCVLVFFFRYNLGSPHFTCVKDLNHQEEGASLWSCTSSGPQGNCLQFVLQSPVQSDATWSPDIVEAQIFCIWCSHWSVSQPWTHLSLPL